MKKYKRYAEFLFEAGVLGKTPRLGLSRHLGGWDQSVSEHLLRTAYVGYVLASLEEKKEEKVDVRRVLEICLFHDLAEARTIDLDYISQKYVKIDEFKAISDAVKDLVFADRILSAFKEEEERSTTEGVIARDADQLELLVSLKEIIDDGNKVAAEWIPPLLKRLRTKSAKRLAKAIIKTNSHDWWYQNKKDKYWTTGGKGKK